MAKMLIDVDIENSSKAINTIKDIILQTVSCKRIYLFGSYAYGTPHKDSDYDFYIVIPDDGIRPAETTDEIYHALCQKTAYEKPVDILVKKISDFDGRRGLPTLENEVASKGVVLYES